MDHDIRAWPREMMVADDTAKKLWDEADRTGQPVPLGDTVICDFCNGDFTDSEQSGGFIFGSYAYCPACAEKGLPNIQKYGEENHIRARCPEGVSFADFCRRYRGPDAYVQVTVFNPKPAQPICVGCNKHPAELDEYTEIAEEEGMTPDDYVRAEEGTYNRENGHFLCTACYFKAGMPSSPTGWVAP